MKKNKLKMMLGCLVLLFGIAYIVQNKEQVTFIKNQEYLNDIIMNYLKETNQKENLEEETHNFINFETFGMTKDSNYKYVYLWVYDTTYHIENDEPILDSASSMPYKFTLKDDVIVKSEIPKDGTLYKTSIEELFPKSIKNKIINYDVTKLQEEQKKEVQEYYSNK